MPNLLTTTAWLIYLVFLGVGYAWAQDATRIDQTGAPTLDIRLRHERAAQDVPGRKTGDATTLRARLGYLTSGWRGWDAFGEFEGVWSLGDDTGYNSLLNGATDHSVIADPADKELNRAWVRYRGFSDTTLKIGRQRLILDNARFVGNVGWRQNEQTFDALSLENTYWPGLKLHYVYADSAETILFTSREMHSHFLNIQYNPQTLTLAVTAYAYLLDFDLNTPLDSQTLGLRITGEGAWLGYTLEYANQGDYADSKGAAVKPRADYYLLELQAPVGPLTATAGYEVLEGDNDAVTAPFSTPLATLHKFQGWADIFLSTPATGVADLYLALGMPIGPTQAKLVYHDYTPDASGPDHGDEIDLLLKWPVKEKITALVKFADYTADGFGVDTRRLWLQVEYRL